MSAQAGDAITLAYGPQGAQQAGAGLVLSYSPPVQVRRTLSADMRAPWGAAHARTHEIRAPYVPARAVNHRHHAPWGKYTQRRAAEPRNPWGVARAADTERRAPWGKFVKRLSAERSAPWGVARALDVDAQAPWGSYSLHLTLAVQMPWGDTRHLDIERNAPWGRFARQPGADRRIPWAAPRKVDAERWLPWTRFSKQLAPGWGVVVPDGNPPVDENGTVIVPIRSVYVTVNTLTLTRASDGALIPCAAFSMSLDVDSWTWQWQATLHADALPLITPGPGGDPVEVLATVNGSPFRLACESYTRQRQFANTRISVQGRGRAAILDAPYAPTLNHGNSASRTAQQLMGDVLTINGVGIGWDVDWGLTDWLVPGNIWALQGSYIAGILDIAGAAGGYVQPHDTAQTLRVLPRYPAAPWDWHTLTPDYELPAAVVSVEGTEWLQKPAYNRVFVSGTTAGVLGQVTRGGTAGEVVAPMVTHSLITHQDAARQRGIAVLGDTGRQARLSLRLPVLEETGVIKPGALVRYVDNGVPQIGLVRGTQVEWSRPTLRQVLAVETHPA